MSKNIGIVAQLFKRGTVIWIPAVQFPNGVTKAKYAILLEDALCLYEKDGITACLTTSRYFKQLESWQCVAPASILDRYDTETTTIDCLNRILVTESQLIKCKFINYLPEDILKDLNEANEYAEFILSKISQNPL